MSAQSSSSSRQRLPHSTFGSRTDIGCVRKHNEDSLVVAPPLFVVADGMGGHAAGEVASEIAVDTIAECAPSDANAEALGAAVSQANHAIIKASREGVGREGMGTTVTAAIIEGERLVIAQVGDSRAYLMHKGRLQQLTRDHSLVADMVEAGEITEAGARVHPNRSVITRALGSDPETQADLYEINVESGDRLLLCSDGLSGMLPDDAIEDILKRITDPQRCASTLVSEAIAAGGHDNVTVIVVDVTGYREIKQKKVSRKAKASIFFVILALVLTLGSAVFAFNFYTENSAYLGVENNKVAVYRGVPGEILGLQFSQLEYLTDIYISDLQPGVANRIEANMRVDNLEVAKDLIEQYREEISAKNAANNSSSSSIVNTGEGESV